MKIETVVLAPDSFKESATAREVCDAMERGIKKVNPQTVCIKIPMADGGEGTMHSLVDATRGDIHYAEVSDPLGRRIKAPYGILGDGETGVIEMAAASGLHLLKPYERNPLKTTTRGTGELILACLNQGVKKILIGIGGSATNDGGAGMVQALGGRFLDERGRELPPGGGSLKDLYTIDLAKMDPRVKEVVVEVACDVNNPLTGPKGASRVFGPQKGGDDNMVAELDKALWNYSQVILRDLNRDILDLPGGGAAGGLGAGLAVFLNGRLERGVDMVISAVHLEEAVKKADLILTGEGSLDSQTAYGKTPWGVARLGKKHSVPVVALAGNLGEGWQTLYEHGFHAFFCTMKGVMPLDKAMSRAEKDIESVSENIMRLLTIGKPDSQTADDFK